MDGLKAEETPRATPGYDFGRCVVYARTIEAIDEDLRIECAVLAYEQRSGRLAAGFLAAWAKIDQLLDERMAMRPMRHALPRAQHGPAV